MSTWNKKNFSIYTSDERSALGLIEELGNQTNYNTEEIEKVKESDNKKVSHDEMNNIYKIDKNADFTGSWHGIKKPTASQEGLQATVDKIVEEDIPNINSQLDTKASLEDLEKTNSDVNATNLRVDGLIINSGNANAEVTDAHVSTAKNKTYTTLRNRLEENENELGVAYSRQETIFNKIDEIPTSLNWSEMGYMYNASGDIVYSEYAGSIRAVKLPLKPNHTYEISNFWGSYYLYDNTGKNGGAMQYHQPVTVPYDPLIINVPKNVGYIGLNLTTSASPISDFKHMYRTTPTYEEMKNCKFEMPNLITNNTNNLKGKIILNFGDSIFGQARPPYDISTKLAELTGATVYNCGFGGCQMGYHAEPKWDAFSMYRLADSITSKNWSVQDNALALGGQPSYFAETVALLKTIDFTKVDIITISYGTNDFTNGLQPIKADSNNIFYAVATSLQYSIEKIQSAFPNVRIFICTPTYRAWLGGDNEFIKDSNTATHKPWVSESDGSPSIEHTFLELIQGIKDIAKVNQLPIIDNYYDLGINKYNRLNYFPESDNVHHNQNGRNLIALNMAHKLY